MTEVKQQTLSEFLLARIGEDEAVARGAEWVDPPPFGGVFDIVSDCDCGESHLYSNYLAVNPARVLAECEAKRRIIEFHRDWPVLVETEPTLEPADPTDMSSMTFRMSQQIKWMTEREYVARFGTEPPTTPILRALALPYADHPDYRDEWRP